MTQQVYKEMLMSCNSGGALTREWTSLNLFFNSGFEPRFDADLCTACETCIERCPAEALIMGDNEVPQLNLDRCFGCAVCAGGCPAEAIAMKAKSDFPAPPKDPRELVTSLL